jgi:hypothetical protein
MIRGKGVEMESAALFGIMYVAIGAGLFAQPDPGTAETGDFTPLRQAEIFIATLPAVLGWPLVLLRRLGA